MNEASRPLEPVRGTRLHGNVLVQSMRDNIRELNRSMSSIEKMIAQSRQIIHESRENSLSKPWSREKRNSPYKALIAVGSPRNDPKTVKKMLPHQIHNNSPMANPASNRSGEGSKGSNVTFGYSSKFNTIHAEKASIEHHQNLIKFQPTTIKKEIELRRSGVRNS
jgi:hypothetical protein